MRELRAPIIIITIMSLSSFLNHERGAISHIRYQGTIRRSFVLNGIKSILLILCPNA